MTRPVATGVVGYGYWGPNLARCFNHLPGSRLAAVADPKSHRLDHFKKLHPGIPSHADFRKLLEDEVDAVAIATPLRTHYSIARAALLAGKHVLIEKPMAASTAECEDLIAIARDRGLTLMVGHTYLYSEAFLKISGIIASGEIGEVRYINCQRLNLGLFQNDINVAWDLAPHDLSIILRIMGALPLSVNCQGNAHINPDIEDVTNISLSFPGKRFATIQSSWLEPRKVRQMTFVGTRKMIVFDDLQPLEKIRIYDVRVDRPPHYDSFAEFQYSYHYGDCHVPHIGQREPLMNLCEHFVSAVSSGARVLSPGENGAEIVRILEAAQVSLRAGGTPVSLAEPRIVPISSAARALPEAG